jgi:hypothetical protein
METTRKGTVVILERGKEIEVNKDFAEALVKGDPDNYAFPGKESKPKPEPKPKDTGGKPEKPVKEEKHLTDGKLTKEDLEALKRPDLIALAKKVEVDATGKNAAIVERIWEKVQGK